MADPIAPALTRYVDVVRKNDALEKRLTQMHHTQTLSAQTILALRTDLSDARRSLARQPSSAPDVNADPARNRFLEQMNRQLEVRLSALEQDLVAARRDAARWRDACGSHAMTLGDSTKARLAVLMAQIAPPRPSRDASEEAAIAEQDSAAAAIHQTLAELVAENTLLRHDNTELSLALSDTREQVRHLREEADALCTTAVRSSQLPVLTKVETNSLEPTSSDASAHRHGRTASRASQRHSICGIGGVATASTKNDYPRPLALSLSNAANTSHSRHYSLTPSMASHRSSSGNPPPPYTTHTRTDSFTPSLASPRSSIAAGSLIFERDENGVPILPPGIATSSPRLEGTHSSFRRPSAGRRAGSIDRPGMISRAVSGVSSIPENSLCEGEPTDGPPVQSQTHERDPSQSSSSSDAANTSMSSTTSKRLKRLSLTPSFRPPVSPLTTDGYFPPQTNSLDILTASPNTITVPSLDSIPLRKPLRLLSCSVGVQTDPVDPHSTPTILLTETNINNKATLSGLGFEETVAAAPSSNQSTPQLASPYSPFPPTPVIDSPSIPQDGRTTSLLLLIEHMSKILLRLRQADVPTLTRRLRKQHLAGDVGHLSSTTLKALTTQVAEIRAHFRGVLDDEKRHQQYPQSATSVSNESLVTRKDFQLLLKLFKELFTELIELRTSVNQVILDPLAVARLKQSIQASIDMTDPAEHTTAGKGKATKAGAAGGLGWIAAPITKLFAASGPAEDPIAPSAIQPNPRSAPKLEASTSASTTHVNVEFASTGIIRRATHALPVTSTVATDAADPYNSLTSISPPDTLSRVSISRKGAGGGTIKARPRPAITLGDGTVRGTAPTARAGLMGIFAGAPTPSARQTLKPKPSLDFHATQRRLAGHHRRQVSNAVNAVIDQPLPEDAGQDDVSPLLERTLRPRGLSDSSIRSTFQSHGLAAPVNAQSRAYAPVASSYWPDSRSMVKTFGKRIQAFTGSNEPVSATPALAEATQSGPMSSSISVHSNASTSSGSHPVLIRNKPSLDTVTPMLGNTSCQPLGTSYMDILSSTSLIIDNPHLTQSSNYSTTDFAQTPL